LVNFLAVPDGVLVVHVADVRSRAAVEHIRLAILGSQDVVAVIPVQVVDPLATLVAAT
jgi:hypothetical protein